MKLLPAKVPKGLTLLEVIAIMAAFSILLLMLLPALAPRKITTGQRINCINNLKQVGLGLHDWSSDNSNLYPFEVSVTNGGTMEAVGKDVAYVHFASISNEISTPKVLYCPNDVNTGRVCAITFDPKVATQQKRVLFNSNSNLSYFINVSADEQFPQAFQAGDWEISQSNFPLQSGSHVVTTNAALNWWRPPHGTLGNILLGDGSVQQLNGDKLSKGFYESGLATNRFEIP